MGRGRTVGGRRAELGLGVWGLPATVWGMGGGPAQGGGSELVTLGERTQSCELGCQGRGWGGWNFPDGTVGVVCSPRRPGSAFALNTPKAEKGAGPPVCPYGRFLLWTVDGRGELEL